MVKDLIAKIMNLEKQFNNLASRDYGEKAENARIEVEKAKAEIKAVSDEAVENAITMADFMEEYYMQQYD